MKPSKTWRPIFWQFNRCFASLETTQDTPQVPAPNANKSTSTCSSSSPWSAVDAFAAGAQVKGKVKLTVSKIKHVPQPDADIDTTASVDVRTIDALVFGCNMAAQDAIAGPIPAGSATLKVII